MNKKCTIVMKRHFLSLVLFAALVPFSACSSCDAVNEQLDLCMASELDYGDATECTTCIQNWIFSSISTATCDELEPAICSIFSCDICWLSCGCLSSTCDCGSCTDEIQASIVCNGNEVGCQFECDPPPVTNPPVTSPPLTSPPSTSSSCDAITDQFVECALSELDVEAVLECDDCTADAFYSFDGGAPCDEFEPLACSALSCSCGSCIGPLEATFNCLGDERGCQLECGNTDRVDSGGASMRFYPSVVLGLFLLICM